VTTKQQANLLKARAAMRLANDGEPPQRVIAFVPELKKLLNLDTLSAKTVERWIMRGRSGRRLDGVRESGRGWVTTRAAVLRFCAEVRCVEESGARPAAT
jgi:hypothetical protein